MSSPKLKLGHNEFHSSGNVFSNNNLKKTKLSKAKLIGFSIVFAAIGGYFLFRSFAASSPPTPMSLISRNVPAFTNNGTASQGNDSSYDTRWWASSTPAWLAYNLSSVPAAQRGQVLVAWYNDPMTSPFDHSFVGEIAYNNLGSYTIEGNAAPGGSSAPTSGWVTLLSITNNKYHSREHVVNMSGYNWIRLNVSVSDGSSGNTGAAANVDVYDASGGVTDGWMFIGDSITMDGMNHASKGTTGNFSQLINAGNSNYFPPMEEAGIGGLTSNEGAANVATWISTFPGKYVGLSYGTNDANGCMNTTTFYNNYVTMVNAVLAAGKIPVIPTIPASPSSSVQSCGPGINAKIQQIYTNFPQVIKGPDLWAYFTSNPNFQDNLHPSDVGYAGMRQQWANAMLTAVYNVASSPPSGGDVDGDGHVTVTDLSILLSHYGQSYAAADFNSNNTVDIVDLSILLSNYGK